MQIEDYTEKSYAVFGETQPWAEDLKLMHGTYKPNLRGRPGWVFSKKHDTKLHDFVDRANAGHIRPGELSHAPPPKRSPRIARPSLTPTSSSSASSLTPSPHLTERVPLPRAPAGIHFPNRFTAGDGAQYQIVIYTVPLPAAGQNVIVRLEGANIAYTVHDIVAADAITIIPADTDTAATDPIPVTPVEVCAGRWQIRGMMDSHEVIFD